VDISTIQYQRGKVNFQPVVYMQQILAARQDELAASRGAVAANVVAIYKALGGGWQARMMGSDIPSDAAPSSDEAPVEVVPLPEESDERPPAEAAPPQDVPATTAIPTEPVPVPDGDHQE
jgi:hypothetical protein